MSEAPRKCLWVGCCNGGLDCDFSSDLDFLVFFWIFSIFLSLLFSCFFFWGVGMTDSKPGGKGISDNEDVDEFDFVFFASGSK